MTDTIDYSRPVGWWCLEIADYRIHPDTGPCKRCIPRFLPIPEGQRPLVEDEVDDAEVVTFTIPGTVNPAWCAPPGWTTFHDTAEEIYEIVVGINLWAKGATE